MDVQNYVALSHQTALRRRLDVVANNLANMNTTGYQRESVMFNALVDRMQGAAAPGGQAVSYVIDRGIARDVTQGDFHATGNPLDLAIDGPGYFSVRTADGATAYTRNGRVQILSGGILGLSSGEELLDTAGQPIRIETDEKDISVSADGVVSTNLGEKARLAIMTFAQPAAMTRLGNNLLTGNGAEAADYARVQIKSGVLEGSNVKPIVETTDMIDILRSYQSTARLVERMGDVRERAIERLGRVQ